MRKSSRILSILLVACMLISAMVVAVSAAVSTTAPKPDGATGSITAKTYTMGSGTSGNTHKDAHKCTVIANNHLANGTHDGTSHSSTCTGGGLMFQTKDALLASSKYVVVEFDFCADKYLDENGNLTDEDTGKIAYAPQLAFGSYNNKNVYKDRYGYFVTDGTYWYLSGDKVYDSSDVVLSNKANVKNHVTIVDDGTKTHTFLDGEYVGSFNVSVKIGITDFRPGFLVQGAAKDVAKANNFSIATSNIAVNYYSSDYTSGTAYGLDDYLKAGDFKAPLYYCADVVYNANYVHDNAAAGQEAVKVTYADSTSDSYQSVPSFSAAIAAMDVKKLEGASIVSTKSLVSLALPTGIPNLSVTVLGNAKFSPSTSTNYYIVAETAIEGGTVYALEELNINSAIKASNIPTLSDAGKAFVKNGLAYDYDKTTSKLGALQDLNKFASLDVVGTQNKYQQVLPLADPNPTKSPPRLSYYYNSTLTSSAGDLILGKHDYTVIDFDIATQSLFFNDEIEAISVGMYPASSYTYFARILKDANNNFYASADKNIDANDIQIPVAGAWSHFTVVIKTNDADYAKSAAHLYLNGTYVGTTTIALSAPDAAKLYGMGIFVFELSGLSNKDGEPNRADYDFCVDNFAVNYYTDGYDAANAETANTLTSFFKGNDYKTQSLLTLTDIIYNDAYATGKYNVRNDWEKIVVDLVIDDETTKFDSLEAAKLAIGAMSAAELKNATVYSSVDIDVDELLPVGVTGIKLICNGATAFGGTNYRLMTVQTVDGLVCYVLDCLTVAGEGITNVGVITAGKPIVNDHNNGTIGYGYGNPTFVTSETVGTAQFVIKDGVLNEYQQIMNDGTHADVNTGGKFINNNSQIWFGINKTPLSANKYVTFDFDFASDKYLVDGTLSDTGSELAYVDGMQLNFYGGLTFYVIKNNGAWYVSTDNAYSDNDIPLAKEAGVWNHFTFITTSEGKVYAFVDGKYIASATKATTTAIERLIIITSGLNYTAFSYALDNVSVNKYALDGEYGLDAYLANDTYKTSALYEVSDVVYNKDYMYYGFVDGQYAASVTIDGNKENYFNIGSALDTIVDGAVLESRVNVPAYDPEDTIMSYTVITKLGATMAKPADKYYKITKSTSGDTITYVLSRVGEDELVIVNFEIYRDDTRLFSEQASDVKGAEFSLSAEFLAALADLMEYTKGDYKWMIDMGNGFEFADECLVPGDYANEEVTVRIAAIYVTWLNGAGEEVDVEAWFAGNEITPHDIAPLSDRIVTGNGWYDMDYTTWETDGKDMLNNNFVAVALTPMTFTAKMTPVPAVTDVKLNMSLLTKFEANLYITDRPLSNVQLLGIFSDAELTNSLIDTFKYATLDGNTYFLDNFFFDNSAVDVVVSRFVQYTVVYEGGEITLVEEIQVSLLDYAQKVLAQYGCGSEEANLAYNLINYANAAYAYKNGEDFEDAAAFLALEGHEDCTCKNTYAYAGEEVYYGENTLGENVLGWSFDISNEQPAFVVYVMVDEFDNALVEDIEFAFFGINGTEVSDVAVKLVRGENIEIDDVVYATFFFEDMPLYNAAEMFTITVTDATTGEVYVTNCNLATYIDYAIWSEMDAAALKVAEALYSFAKVAKDYKLN